MEINTLRKELTELNSKIELLQLHAELKSKKQEAKKMLFSLRKGVVPFSLRVFRDGFRELWAIGKKLGERDQHNSNIKRRRYKYMDINEDGYLDLSEESEEPKQEKENLTGLPEMDFKQFSPPGLDI